MKINSLNPLSEVSSRNHRRRILAAVTGITLLSTGCGRADEPAEKLPPRVVIEVSITPGKPGAPTETATATYMDAKASLTVKRGATGAAGQEETVSLSGVEFFTVWREVKKGELFSFRPLVRTGEAFDSASHTLVLDSRTKEEASVPAEKGEAYNSVSWDAPLENGESVKPLLTALHQLAKKHCKKLELFYFP